MAWYDQGAGITFYTYSLMISLLFWSMLVPQEKRIDSSCQNIIIRGGRFDMRIPEFVVQQLCIEEV